MLQKICYWQDRENKTVSFEAGPNIKWTPEVFCHFWGPLYIARPHNLFQELDVNVVLFDVLAELESGVVMGADIDIA